MASNGKSATAAAPKASSNSLADLIGDWVRQGTEGFIATQKILLDLAAQQNALALTIVRERLGLFSPTPSQAAIDLAGKGAHNFFEAQRLLLELVARQNKIVADGLKPGLVGTAAEPLADIVHRSLDNFISAQKHFLTVFESETEGAIGDYGEGKRFETARVAEVAREGLRDFLHAQKNFLDIVEDEILTQKSEAEEGTERGRVNMFETAKQSVDAFVEVQKALLDLASDQIDVNVKLAREIFNLDRKSHPTTALPDLVKKSVESFVAAQKALVEVASKPRKAAETAEAFHAEAVTM